MRDKRVNYICTSEESERLAFVATQLARSKSDALRWLTDEAYRKLKADPTLQPANIIQVNLDETVSARS
jgi:hypothetical protein